MSADANPSTKHCSRRCSQQISTINESGTAAPMKKRGSPMVTVCMQAPVLCQLLLRQPHSQQDVNSAQTARRRHRCNTCPSPSLHKEHANFEHARSVQASGPSTSMIALKVSVSGRHCGPRPPSMTSCRGPAAANGRSASAKPLTSALPCRVSGSRPIACMHMRWADHS